MAKIDVRYLPRGNPCAQCSAPIAAPDWIENGPRRTSQVVIRGNAGTTPRVLWTFQHSTATSLAAATRQRVRADEPRLPL